jgi:hypothetical protein
MITIVHGDGVSEVVTVLMFIVVTCLFRSFGELDGASISTSRYDVIMVLSFRQRLYILVVVL